MIEDKLFIISHHACKPCEEVTKAIKDKILIYDLASSDDAFQMLQEGKLQAVPTAFYRDNGDLKKCTIKHSDNKITIDCGKEHLEFQK